MKTSALKALSAVFLASIAASALAGPPPDPKGYYAKPGASAAASASAVPDDRPPPAIVDGHKPWAPTFDVTIPETPSDPPAKGEWESAPIAKEVRVLAPGCKAQRIREWYRIACEFGQRIEVVSGLRDSVSFGQFFRDKDPNYAAVSWVIFPARRGDSRALEVFDLGKWGPQPDTLITEQFLEGDPVPWISVHGIHWGF